MKCWSVYPRVPLYTAHTSTVQTWGLVGRCTVQHLTAVGRAGYLYGTSGEDKMPNLSPCTPENRHVTGGDTLAVSGALNTVRETTNTEHDK